MLKYMIVSDIDGTLLPHGKQHLTTEIFDVIKELISHNIYFVACSGRDYSSLKYMFQEILDDIYFISINGGQIIHRDKIMYERDMDSKLALSIAEELSHNPDLEIIMNVRHTCILLDKNKYIAERFVDYKTNITTVKHFSEISENIMKISVYCRKNDRDYFAEFQKLWGHKINIATSGGGWIDFMNCNKGETLQILADQLSVKTENIYAFGDQYNDLPMLEWVGNPYIMSKSLPELHKESFTKTDNVVDSIRSIMKKIL